MLNRFAYPVWDRFDAIVFKKCGSSQESSTSGFGRSINVKRMSEKACVKCVGLTPIYSKARMDSKPVTVYRGQTYTSDKTKSLIIFVCYIGAQSICIPGMG